MSEAANDADADACSIVSSRELQATPDQVFEAFARPERLARWWGPDGFSNRFEVFELRTGGTWRFTMIGPDGREYANESVFLDVVPGERIVFEHIPPPHFFMTITLAETSPGRTRIHWLMRFDSAQACEGLRAIVVPSNEQNFDRLEAELRRGG